MTAATRLQNTRARMAEPSPIETNRLIGTLNGGLYAEAETAAKGLIDRYPSFGLAWKILGVAQIRQRKNAIDALRGAAALLPNDADVHTNLGNALNGLGRHAEAEASCRRALAIGPDNKEALNNLGNALANLGRLDEAVACYSRACHLDPRYAAAYCNLGNALRGQGRLEESVACCRRAVDLQPGMADAHGNLGNALRDLGRTDAAMASYRQALALEPRHAGVLDHLGTMLRDLGRIDEAAACHWQAVQSNPNLGAAYTNLGHSLIDLGRLNEALESYRRALAANPRDVEAMVAFAMALRQFGRTADAEDLCRKALQAKPGCAKAHAFLGELAADRGQFAAALDEYRRALAIDPDLAQAWIGLGNQRAQTDGDADWLAAVQRLAGKRQPLRTAIDLRFAIGKYFDEMRDFDAAFASYREANELSKHYGRNYDRQKAADQVDETIRRFDAAWFEAAAASGGNDSSLPVYIVGLPRSGTTLVEQILASHPAVFGAGDSTFWPNAAASFENAADRTAALADLRTRMSGEYLPSLLELAGGGAERVVDKMPVNFRHLGLIHSLLPKARIIHVRRDPRDTCLSIYFHNFALEYAYSADLDDLAHQYRLYTRLMDHWRAVLPAGAMLELPYEELIGDAQVWSRRIVEFIGLPWNARCLDFHETVRTVMTRSKWQVRQKISASSVGRWQHYASHAGPLLSLAASDP